MWDAAVLVAALLAARLAGEGRATPLDPPPRVPGLTLSPFVQHWEPAQYEPLRPADARRRRAAPPHHAPATTTQPLRLTFRAHNREFRLRLRPDPGSVFAEDAEFHSTGGALHFGADRVYSGALEDEEGSYVYGVLTADGLFDGTISTPSEEYYVEPLHRYGLTVAPAASSRLHSVVYKHSDVLQPAANSSRPCASQLLHRKRQSGRAGSVFGSHDHLTDELDGELGRRRKRWLPEEDEGMQEDEPRKNPELPLDLDVPYTRNGDPPSTRRPKTQIDKSNLIVKIRDFDDDPNSRPKPKTHVENHVIKTKGGVITLSKDIVRKEPVKGFTVISSTGNSSEDRHVNKRATVDPRKTTCMLYLQADHMFYQRYGSEEACIEVMTRHVQKVNAIYKVTDFNQDGRPDNITFMIKRVKVHTLDALKEPSYRFPNNYGVEKYLELFSEEDYDAFCLAYMFTYRDFEMGTLGLAWTGDLKNAGGVCEKNGHYRGSMKSLNTGIVTLLNYGKHVPPAVSHVTLAHEIGHNFGSPHDPDVCTPGGEDGNYIMFARATSGDKRNNNKFSPCSLRSIDPVLNNKARSAKGCFTEPQPAICGNGVVEEGEECDCGWAAECTDKCCRPQALRPHYKPCTLTETSVCSPSQGPCCWTNCTLKFGDKCREDNGCRDASYCDGRRAQCPSSRHKPNRTRCDKEFVCYMGECTGSICLAYGLESCQCAVRPEGGARAACELCCRAPGGPCVSSFQWNAPPFDVPDVYAKPGTPCNDYNGYCDVFQKCREVDPSGPLATLRKLLLSDESIASFKKWLLDHWYAVLLILLAVVALLVASTRWLGRRSDGKLKSVTIIHSSTTETVRLPDANQQGLIVHTAVRSKLPLKKKVALKTRAYRNRKEAKSKSADKSNGSPAHTTPGKRKTKSSKPEETRPKVTKESTAVVMTGEGKPPKHILLSKHKGKIKKRKGKVKKETIDYSSMQKDATLPGSPDDEALSKVQRWLLSSPQPALLPKSKSTPTGLTDRNQRSPQKQTTRKNRTSKSSNNLLAGEKARLQVVYKPPFRFSVKICKGDKTKVVLDKSARPDSDKRRSEPAVPTPASAPIVRSNSSNKIPKPSNRTSSENVVTSPQQQTPSGSNETVVPAKGESSYENILPRSASDCKLGKKPEAKSRAGHKKSNSVGQRKETTESRQNLLGKEFGSSAHLYENMLVGNEDATKSCSMPRRQPAGVVRQSSCSQLPRAHGPSPRHSAANLTSHPPGDDLQPFYSTIETLRRPTAPGDSGTGSSSGSSLRYSAPSDRYAPEAGRNRKLRRQLSDNEIPSRGRRMDSDETQLRGFRLVVGKEKLKRQLSENELRKPASRRGQVCMPVSAGAEAGYEPGPDGFSWARRRPDPQDERASARNKTNGLKKRASGGRERPHTFGELKSSAPDCPAPAPPATREQVLVSPEDFLKILDT